METAAIRSAGYDELAVLKLLALDGGIDGEVKTSCSALADRLDASNQTASRRLQRLEDAGLIERETVSDGQWIEVTDEGERALRAEYEQYRRIFDASGAVELTGTVTSGMGEGRHYIQLEGYRTQFQERLGYDPFPGTLNVDLTDDSVRRRGALGSIDPVPIDGWESEDREYGPAACYPARIANDTGESFEEAHVIVPERTHHDERQLEVIAPEKLRDRLSLEDGDRVTVNLEEENGT